MKFMYFMLPTLPATLEERKALRPIASMSWCGRAHLRRWQESSRNAANVGQTYGSARGPAQAGRRGPLTVVGVCRQAPEMVYDLPAGGRRLLQRAGGYKYTIVRVTV